MPFVTINNNTLHYCWLDYGRNETVVLINSLGTNFTIWNQMLPNLTDKFNVLLHDKRGHGCSSYSGSDTSIDEYAKDVVSLMNHCNIKKAHVVGLSIGGLIAFSLAKNHPQYLDKLVFSNTGFKIGNKEGWNDRIDTVITNGLSSISDEVIQRWFSHGYSELDSSTNQGHVKMINQTCDDGYIAACRAISKANYSTTAAKMPFKSLFIGGENDLSTPSNFVKTMAKNTKGANFIEIPKVGHLPCVENPEVYVKIIKNFIE